MKGVNNRHKPAKIRNRIGDLARRKGSNKQATSPGKAGLPGHP